VKGLGDLVGATRLGKGEPLRNSGDPFRPGWLLR
jgi:hypothetical protein